MDLKEKLKMKQSQQAEKKIDWQLNKEKWLESISKLYEKVESWLCELHDEGLVNLQYRDIILTEEYLDEYQVTILEIDFGDSCAILEPIGRNIIGGEGRIDFYRQGEISAGFILVLNRDNGGNDNWNMVNKNDKRTLTMLTQDVFLNKLSEWAD